MFLNLINEVKHYHNERTLKPLNEGGWEELRASGNEDYKVGNYKRRELPAALGKYLANFFHLTRHNEIHSYGCGTGANEIEIILQSKEAKINKHLKIIASDNESNSIKELQKINPEINWCTYDFTNGFHHPVSLGIRIESELSTKKWQEIFMKSTAIKILFVCHCYSSKNLFDRYFANIFKSKNSFAGYIRTEKGIKNLFSKAPYILKQKVHLFDNIYLFDLVKK